MPGGELGTTVLQLLRKLCFPGHGLGPAQVAILLPLAVLSHPEAFPFSLAELSPSCVVALAENLPTLHYSTIVLYIQGTFRRYLIGSPLHPWKIQLVVVILILQRRKLRYRGSDNVILL